MSLNDFSLGTRNSIIKPLRAILKQEEMTTKLNKRKCFEHDYLILDIYKIKSK